MFPTLQLGPLSIATPGLILLIGLWVGLELSERQAHHHKVAPAYLYNLVFWSLIAGLLGARLAFVGRYSQAFIKNPSSIFSLNPGMLDPLAGLVIGICFFLIYTNRSKAPLWNVLDALTPGFVVFYFALSLSQLAQGTAFGLPTSLPWGIRLWGENRHPTQIYSMLATAGIFAWLEIQKTWITSKQAGALFLASISMLAAAHLLISGFRADSSVLLAGIRSEQVIAWVILAFGLRGYFKK